MTEQTTRGSTYKSPGYHDRAALRMPPTQMFPTRDIVGARLLITATPENATTLRGGSWCNFAGYCRQATRNRYPSNHQFNSVGFRLAIRS